MIEELLIALTLELSKKKTKIGPELTTYMEGLAYCERVYKMHNRTLDEVMNDGDDPGEDPFEDQEFKINLPDNQH